MISLRSFSAPAIALVALATPALAQQEESVQTLMEKVKDSERRLIDRTDALNEAARMIKGAKIRAGGQDTAETIYFRDEVVALLKLLTSKAKDIDHARFIEALLVSLDPYQPLDEVGKVVRPLLKDGNFVVQVAALRAISVHGARGVGDILEGMVRDNTQRLQQQRMEITLCHAAQKIPPEEGVRVLATALRLTQHREVKITAARFLAEVRGKEGKEALLEASSKDNKDEIIACAAALALLRYWTYEGIGNLVERLKGRPTHRVYESICRAAHKEDEGFMGVPPGDFYGIPRQDRVKVVKSVLEWWDTKKGQTPRTELFEVLAKRGLTVPADPQSKEAVTVLLKALELDPRSLRYSALHEFARLTGRRDAEEDFKSVQLSLGAGIVMREFEPADGFDNPRKAEQLRQEQRQKAARLQDWWKANKDKAEWIGGQWKLPEQ